jgi:acyl dehydratase
MVMDRYYEDIEVGAEYESPSRTVTETDIVTYWNYKFTGPILIGDTVRIRVKIQSKRETKKPDRGVVVEYVTMRNQRDEVVQEGEHGLMIYTTAPGGMQNEKRTMKYRSMSGRHFHWPVLHSTFPVLH